MESCSDFNYKRELLENDYEDFKLLNSFFSVDV